MSSDFRLVKIIDPTAIVTGGLVPKGAYDNTATYAQGDSVSYGGSSYVAISSTTGHIPTNTTYWQLLASQGPAGTPSDEHFEQSFSAVSTVVVTHSLGKKPAVTIIDTSGDECEGDVIHNTNNQLTVNFSAANSGVVLCN